jgi:Calcium-binding EGF domain
VTPDCIRFASCGPRFLLLLALGVAACKGEAGDSERTIDEPSTAADGAVAVQPDTGTGLPPFTLPTFPRRDAGSVAPSRDAGVAPTSPAPVIKTVGPAGDPLVVDSIALDVPAGAVTRQLQITFAALPSPPPGFVGQAWLLSPPTTRFAKPVKVAIWLDEDLLAQAPSSEWVMSTLVNGAWVPLSNTGNDPGGIISFGFTEVLGPFALTRRVPSDAGVPDAALPEDAGTVVEDASADAAEDAAEDAGVDAEVDAALPVPICTQGACANGVCIQGATNYACMCSPGFAAAADQHSCVAVDPCASVMCTAPSTCVAGVCTPPPDPCAAVMCLTGNVCSAGVCACMAGLVPAADGTCVAPPPTCASTCAAPNTCVGEVCTPPTCASTCAAPNTCVGEVCTPPACASTCAAPNTCVGEVCTPPAPVLYCPAGACANGACVEGAADYSCTCSAGYAPAADLHSCADVDECAAVPAVCTADKTCVNEVGSYTCSCAPPNVVDPTSGLCGAAVPPVTPPT